MLNTPILFIIFNRPDTTQVIFDEIKKQQPKYLYVAGDGPRQDRAGEEELCKQTRSIIEQVDWDCEVKTLFQPKNLGCKKGVSTAINWFFENVEEGIILEDDCLPDPTFFNYCEAMLAKYRDNEQVMHISGENPLEIGVGDGSYYFVKTAHIWGWASWRRAWAKYDVDIKEFDEAKLQKALPVKHHFEYWKKVYNRVIAGQIDTWDYQWMYVLFANNGLSIIPNTNLISNIGFGEQATHTSQNSKLANRKTGPVNNIDHPQNICPNEQALDMIMKERFGVEPKTPLFLLKRELHRTFKKFFGN